MKETWTCYRDNRGCDHSVDEHWRARAEYLSVGRHVRWLVGEDENADLWVPYRKADVVSRHEYGWVRFNRWNPLHWFCYWNSRRRGEVVFLYG
jgi:hypothetical protein